MEGPDGQGAGDAPRRPEDLPENDSTAEANDREPSVGVEGNGTEAADPEELQRRLAAKDQHIRELYQELTAARVAADEARARTEAGEGRARDLEEERARLRRRVRAFEEDERARRRRDEGRDRRVARLERQIERLKGLLGEKEDELATRDRAARDALSRKDTALTDALRRVEGLERDLDEREEEVDGLRIAAGELRAELEREYELRRRMAEPENRLRAGIQLFNDSEHHGGIGSLSRSMGQPEVHVALGSGEEPPVILTFTWRGITWRTYVANPGPAVEEPRVYQISAGEDLSGVGREPPNAHIGPGGRVVLGL
jgi:hypothetical protein